MSVFEAEHMWFVSVRVVVLDKFANFSVRKEPLKTNVVIEPTNIKSKLILE